MTLSVRDDSPPGDTSSDDSGPGGGRTPQVPLVLPELHSVCRCGKRARSGCGADRSREFSSFRKVALKTAREPCDRSADAHAVRTSAEERSTETISLSQRGAAAWLCRGRVSGAEVSHGTCRQPRPCAENGSGTWPTRTDLRTYARISCATFPCTSVRRKSRPA